MYYLSKIIITKLLTANNSPIVMTLLSDLNRERIVLECLEFQGILVIFQIIMGYTQTDYKMVTLIVCLQVRKFFGLEIHRGC